MREFWAVRHTIWNLPLLNTRVYKILEKKVVEMCPTLALLQWVVSLGNELKGHGLLESVSINPSTFGN